MSRDKRAIEAARAAVQVVAPEEMPLFDATVRAWRRRGRGSDDMLGFGIGGVEPVITPAALAAASTVAGFLARTVVDAARDETSTVLRVRVRGVVRRLFGCRAPAGPAADPHASVSTTGIAPAELARIREVTLARLLAAGLPAERAALVADAVIGALVTAG